MTSQTVPLLPQRWIDARVPDSRRWHDVIDGTTRRELSEPTFANDALVGKLVGAVVMLPPTDKTISASEQAGCFYSNSLLLEPGLVRVSQCRQPPPKRPPHPQGFIVPTYRGTWYDRIFSFANPTAITPFRPSDASQGGGSR